ncbi:glycosyltransferase family 9 protein [Paraburkholderia aspalathi]|uniref:glycosyltransferase family 9 protein n=1 Tax=Paraburkholderia aspalathi TaxID=1324617 RepID=UPI00355670C1
MGADGGLMHIAAALGKPGVAIFCQIKPEWRLHAQSTIRTVSAGQDIDRIPIERIASEVTDYCRELLR